MVTEPGVELKPRPLKVATPDEAVAVPVPTTEPIEGVAVTTLDAVVTLLPPESRTSIIGCVVNAVPYAEPAALRVTANCVAAPTVGVTDWVATVNALPPYDAE
jgi:uncharacterized NAD-dependent epimerase/dehydratase family protein